MRHFWTYVKAEFVVHTLSVILFSGKFPRVVAICIALAFGIVSIIFWGFRIIYLLIRWICISEEMLVKKEFRSIAKVGKKFGDQSSSIEFENGAWKMLVFNPNFQHGIQSVEIRVVKGSSQLQIWLSSQNAWIPLWFETISQALPPNKHICMHRDFAAYIYYYIRMNLL